MNRLTCILLPLLVLSPGTISAQAPEPRTTSPAANMPVIEQERSAPTWKLLAGGVIGGAIGYGVVHYSVKPDPPNPHDHFISGEEVRGVGAWMGMSVGIPVGTHVANGGRGSWGWSVLASLGIGVLGGVLLMTQDAPVYLVLTPAAQLWASTAIAQAGSR